MIIKKTARKNKIYKKKIGFSLKHDGINKHRGFLLYIQKVYIFIIGSAIINWRNSQSTVGEYLKLLDLYGTLMCHVCLWMVCSTENLPRTHVDGKKCTGEPRERKLKKIYQALGDI